MRKAILVLIGFLLILSSSAFGAEEVIVNSKDWKDVYSVTQYGYITGGQPNFLVSEKHSTLILTDVDKEKKITVYSSKKNPFVIGYESLLESKGYDAEEVISDSLSLELARELTDIKNYVIVDDAYGYNAIAVAPYAVVSDSYVLFADENNINDIVDFLEEKGSVGDIIIYGTVDREVHEALEPWSPEVINYDGDKFANNVEIVKRFKQIKNEKQVLLTNGEFIEAEIMAGSHPVLFIGIQNVPDKIKEYIKNSDIEVGVLIGNDLVSTATTVKRQTGISTFIKFARSARNPSGPVAEIEGLDIFRVPKVVLNIGVEEIRYNALTKQLEVTIKNNGDAAAYLKGTYSITYGEDGSQTVGDAEPVFINGNDVKTIVYNVDAIPDGVDIQSRVYVIFGESKDSLEMALDGTFDVSRVQVADESELTIEKVIYDKAKGQFLIYVNNIGSVDSFASAEIVDLRVLGESRTYASEDTEKVSEGGSAKIKVNAELSDEELELNSKIRVRVYHGQRENALVKVLETELEFETREFNVVTYIPIAVIVMLILLIFITRRRKKDER